MKDTGKWKCVFTKKTMFQNEDLGRQLSGDKVSSHKLVLEGHISVLSFSEDFGSQAMLSHTLLSSPAPQDPGPHWLVRSRLQQDPTAGQLPGRGQNSQSLRHKLFSGYPNTEAQPGPVPAWEEVSRLGWALCFHPPRQPRLPIKLGRWGGEFYRQASCPTTTRCCVYLINS